MNTTIEGYKGPESSETGLKKSSPLEAQKTKDNLDSSNTLIKINDILEKVDKADDIEEGYRQKLQKLDNASLDQLLKLDNSQLEELLQKPQTQIKQQLIQAQINDLEKKGLANLTNEEFVKFGNLKKQLIALENNVQVQQRDTIAVEKAESKNNDRLIAEENSKQQAYSEVNKKLASIKGSLSILQGENSKVAKIFNLITEADTYKVGPNASSEEVKEGAAKMNEKLESVLNILRDNTALTTITKDLKEYDQKNGTNTYETFRTTIEKIDPSIDFEKANHTLDKAKIKLGNSNLEGVKVDGKVLSKTEDGVTTTYSKKEGRYLNSDNNNFKVKSKLNPNFEEKIDEVYKQANEVLKPISESLSYIVNIENYLKEAQSSGLEFSKAKQEIKSQNLELYNELGLDNKNSYDEMIGALASKKKELEEKAKKIKDKASEEKTIIIAQNEKDARLRDKYKKEMIRFFDAIGVTKIGQEKFNKIVEVINLTPGKFGLDNPIDIENGVLGFNKDLGDASLSSTEKQAFIQLFNRILGENVVDENIALGMTTLSPEAVMRLQVLNNKTTGYFLANLDR